MLARNVRVCCYISMSVYIYMASIYHGGDHSKARNFACSSFKFSVNLHSCSAKPRNCCSLASLEKVSCRTLNAFCGLLLRQVVLPRKKCFEDIIFNEGPHDYKRPQTNSVKSSLLISSSASECLSRLKHSRQAAECQ